MEYFYCYIVYINAACKLDVACAWFIRDKRI
jgi:hypothetical protein